MDEKPVIKLGRVEHAFYQAGVKHGSGYSLSEAANQMRAAAQHYTDQGESDIAKAISDVIGNLATQLDTRAESEKKESARQLNHALKIMRLRSPSLSQRCKNALIGLARGWEKRG